MIQATARVMQNNTICIPKKIREKLSIREKDLIIVKLDGNKASFKKAPSTWMDLAKVAPNIFKKYGGGEKYLKKERESWNE